ncbi:MAG: transcriptional regulator [Planctomycetes bacterium]|nr:transcriptional regulator [Planctomycetota bacterium]
MSRGDQLLRQWELLRTLPTRGAGTPLADLADRFAVSERTIQRDFEILQALGFPIAFEADEQGKRFWRMPHDFFKNGSLTISLTEALALHLAAELLVPFQGTHLADGLAELMAKIRRTLPESVLTHFANLGDILYVRRAGRTDYSKKADLIRVLSDASHECRCVEIAYRSLWRGQEYATRCDPYGLVFHDEDLYLVAHSHRAGAIRVFKIARVLSAELKDDHFERPADFRLEEHFRTSFGIVQSHSPPVEIAVKFSGAGAALVEERMWHESQQLDWIESAGTLFEPAIEGAEGLVATFTLGNVVEFKRWILGFGPLAEILRPDWLRVEVAEALRLAAGQYMPSA